MSSASSTHPLRHLKAAADTLSLLKSAPKTLNLQSPQAALEQKTTSPFCNVLGMVEYAAPKYVTRKSKTKNSALNSYLCEYCTQVNVVEHILTMERQINYFY